jgi:hypothetical protein
VFSFRETRRKHEVQMKIVLFEDDPTTAQRIATAVKRHVKSEVSIFTPRENSHDGRPYEERLSAEVLLTPYKGATLWVTDRDLSKTTGYRGLSEAIVSKAATQLGIPVCKYARGRSDDDVFDRQRSWGDAQNSFESL